MAKFYKRLATSLFVLMTVFFAGHAYAADTTKDVKLKFLTVGKDDAPVTIIEFSSYTCPHCANFHAENRVWLIKNYVDTGRVKLVLHDYPLDGLAMGAAMIVQRAPEGTAAALSETLFKMQHSWMRNKLPRVALTNLAGLAGMSKEAVDKALDDKALLQALLDKRTEAHDTYGIEATPSLLINGQEIAANAEQSELALAIEAAESAAKSAMK